MYIYHNTEKLNKTIRRNDVNHSIIKFNKNQDRTISQICEKLGFFLINSCSGYIIKFIGSLKNILKI